MGVSSRAPGRAGGGTAAPGEDCAAMPAWPRDAARADARAGRGGHPRRAWGRTYTTAAPTWARAGLPGARGLDSGSKGGRVLLVCTSSGGCKEDALTPKKLL